MNTPASSRSQKAYMYLVKIISARDYSEHKLREKLRERKYPADEIEYAINEIKSKGYLREEVYAEARVKAFMHKGYAPNYIRQKLAQEHVEVTDEEIEAIFAEYRTSPEEQIDRLVRKKMHGKTEFDYAGESKILRYLISKGHDFGAAKKIMKGIIIEVRSEQ
ncbi:MAG: regulatory protein RecX [Alphaproteobacteria bacterium]|nr:MAG: regulatory protein RecX [Alphaproteobacteria bacterium]